MTTGKLPPVLEAGTQSAHTLIEVSWLLPWPSWMIQPSSRFGSGVLVFQSMRPGKEAAIGSELESAPMLVVLSVSWTPPLIAMYFCEVVALLG